MKRLTLALFDELPIGLIVGPVILTVLFVSIAMYSDGGGWQAVWEFWSMLLRGQ